ncbi:interleukin-20 receptor subunit beta [Etheostoma spectabile]|uniref:interleukin-20 receptor subunit beta n=1 Tax=Etheostoma spectabile TaxID=54343 RepID=UPI0013AEC42B|nr:interleukin-20 receptor subunit beta-like [Etheostoma spectabile]
MNFLLLVVETNSEMRPPSLLLTMVLLNGVWMLPAPTRVAMESVNMRHVLRWRPPPQAGGHAAVLYSVQFQGEFELTVLNGSWVDAPECQLTPQTHCDLTSDLGSDSDYNVRVRAQRGDRRSPWTRLHPPFNRRHTVLTAPDMSVTAVGDALHVTFNTLPLIAVVSVTVWRKGHELQADVYTRPAEQTPLHVAALQDGAVYCVRAHIVLNTHLSSRSTETQCVSITGPGAAWKKPTTVTGTVVMTAGLLFAVFWAAVHCPPHVCQSYFRKEPLPLSLSPDWDVRTPTLSSEEAELCEQIRVSVDPQG